MPHAAIRGNTSPTTFLSFFLSIVFLKGGGVGGNYLHYFVLNLHNLLIVNITFKVLFNVGIRYHNSIDKIFPKDLSLNFSKRPQPLPTTT